MEKVWRVVDYQEKYLESFLQLFKDSYPRLNLGSRAFFKKIMLEGPSGKAIIKLAVNEPNDVVGCYFLLPLVFVVGGRKLIGSLSLNTLVRPDYRNFGIFTKLAQEAFLACQERKIDFTVGFPNQNSYYGFVHKLGFDTLGELALLIKPINFQGLVKYKTGIRLPRWVFYGGERLFNRKTPRINKDFQTITKLEKESIDKFIKKYDRNQTNMLLTDYDYLNWRLDWPGKNYRFIAVKEDGALMSYAITTEMEVGGIRNGLLVDFKILPGIDEGWGYELLRLAQQHCCQSGVDLIGYLSVPGTREFKILKKCGFVICPKLLKPQPMLVVLKWHNPNVPPPHHLGQLEKWFWVMIDYDVA